MPSTVNSWTRTHADAPRGRPLIEFSCILMLRHDAACCNIYLRLGVRARRWCAPSGEAVRHFPGLTGSFEKIPHDGGEKKQTNKQTEGRWKPEIRNATCGIERLAGFLTKINGSTHCRRNSSLNPQFHFFRSNLSFHKTSASPNPSGHPEPNGCWTIPGLWGQK